MKKIIVILVLLQLVYGCGLTSKDTSAPPDNSAKLKVYAASGKGMAFSENSGSSWRHYQKTRTNDLPDDHLNCIYVLNKDNYYVGSDKGFSATTNNAQTWVNATTKDGLGSNKIRAIQAVGSTIYAATAGGLSISTDNAKTWHNYAEENGLAARSVNDVLVDGGRIYLGTGSGLIVSSDNAKTWENYKVTGNIINRLFIKGTDIYLAGDNGLFISSKNIIALKKYEYKGVSDFFKNRINFFYIDHRDRWWAGSAKGLVRSHNKGQSWRLYDEADGVDAFEINDAVVVGKMVFAATNKGLAVSNDHGENWVTYNKDEGLKSLTLKRLVVR